MLKDAAALILKHTVVTRQHLTPEIPLHLITRACALWRATEDQLPFPDPYWAFYWPGGQGTARAFIHTDRPTKSFRARAYKAKYLPIVTVKSKGV